MKNFVFILFALTFTGILFSSFNEDEIVKLPLEDDTYKVIRVNGEIVFQKSGNAMKTGDVFNSTETLSFKSSDSRAAVISKKKGRFVITSKSAGNSRANLIPAMNNISSRAGALLNLIDLQNHFKGKYVVLGNQKLQIGEKAFPMSNNQFFYLQYTHNGETVRKKLSFEEGNKLLLNSGDIFKVDGKSINVQEKSMILYYRDAANKTSKKISTFTPIFPNLEELKAELLVIKSEYADKSDKELKNEITAYINQFYGKPDKDNLTEFLKDKMGM